MKENGKIIEKMALQQKNIKMGDIIKENLKKVQKMEQEHIIGKMVLNMKESGKII